MKLQYFLVGMLIASAFVVGITTFLGDLTVNTGMQVNGSWNNTYGNLTQIMQAANETSSQFTQSPISTVSINPLQLSSWPTLQITFSSYKIVYGVITAMFNQLQIPTWVSTLILTLITFALIFAILAAIFFGRQV